jgi:hypothetical protein
LKYGAKPEGKQRNNETSTTIKVRAQKSFQVQQGRANIEAARSGYDMTTPDIRLECFEFLEGEESTSSKSFSLTGLRNDSALPDWTIPVRWVLATWQGKAYRLLRVKQEQPWEDILK